MTHPLPPPKTHVSVSNETSRLRRTTHASTLPPYPTSTSGASSRSRSWCLSNQVKGVLESGLGWHLLVGWSRGQRFRLKQIFAEFETACVCHADVPIDCVLSVAMFSSTAITVNTSRNLSTCTGDLASIYRKDRLFHCPDVDDEPANPFVTCSNMLSLSPSTAPSSVYPPEAMNRSMTPPVDAARFVSPKLSPRGDSRRIPCHMRSSLLGSSREVVSSPNDSRDIASWVSQREALTRESLSTACPFLIMPNRRCTDAALDSSIHGWLPFCDTHIFLRGGGGGSLRKVGHLPARHG
jgi:hypothetical protein